jgi:hypothetical protein
VSTTPFDFEAFIAGTNLPRFEVPLYRIVHQRRIDELTEQIDKASEKEVAGDFRESTIDTTPDLTAERDRLVAEQEASAQWVELRALSADEYDALRPDDKDVLDQISIQSRGTRNEGDRDKWAAIRKAATPGAWMLFVARANEIVVQTSVMPDFSLTDSKTPHTPSES